jgi:hypothetical protein
MTKSYGLLISKWWDTVYQTPKEKYISMFITENWRYIRKIRKDGWAWFTPLKGQLRGLSCVHATVLNL